MARSNLIRVVNLAGLAVLGLAVGYVGVIILQAPEEAAGPSALASPEPGVAPQAAPPEPAAEELADPWGRQPNPGLVGGLTPDDRRRFGVPEVNTAAQPVPLVPDTRGDLLPPPEEGPPTASRYPESVRVAAGRYFCLCGCDHVLDVCPCNDQPVGAGTMLNHLQKLIDQGLVDEALDAGMVDRYGDRVLVSP